MNIIIRTFDQDGKKINLTVHNGVDVPLQLVIFRTGMDWRAGETQYNIPLKQMKKIEKYIKNGLEKKS